MRAVDEGSQRNSLSDLLQGASLLLDGARFIRRHRGLWPFALVPMGFALVGVGAATTLFALGVEDIHARWVELLPVLEVASPWHWLYVGPGRLIFWGVGWLAVLATFALSLVAGLLVANLASAPFLDQLSERVEAIASGTEQAEGGSGFAAVVRGASRSFAAELQRLGFLAFAWISVSALGFVIPGGQLIAAPALVAITIFFLPLDFAGFALDRRELSFSQRRRWLRANRSLMLGYGAVAFLACGVPGLNLVLWPAQVAAGTLVVVRRPPNE
jgi:CysZ protein